jgi:hypothetical protein
MGNTNTVFKWLALIVTTVLVGCSPDPIGSNDVITGDKPSSPSISLQSVLDHTRDSTNAIDRDSKIIASASSNAREILSTTYDSSTAEQKPRIDSTLTALQLIASKAENINESSADIKKESTKLASLTVQVDKLENKLITLGAAVEVSRIKALEKLYGYITMFWVIGFTLLAAGAAVAFFLNKTYGASMCLLGILMIGFASASQYYMEEIAFAGAILLILGFVVGLAMISWSVVRSNRNDVAIKEIVEMIEILRETMTDDEKQRIFGVDGLASKVQSDLTKQIVFKVKEKNGFSKLKEIKETVNGDSTKTN